MNWDEEFDRIANEAIRQGFTVVAWEGIGYVFRRGSDAVYRVGTPQTRGELWDLLWALMTIGLIWPPPNGRVT